VLAGKQEIAFRVLSIFGFLATVLCLFILIRKKRGSAVALFCAALPLVTALYGTYAVEARPYSLIVACIAFALVCYQRAPAPGWTALLGLSLVIAQCLHYYSVLLFSPLLIAELALFLMERKPRWGVWLALTCGFFPLAVLWPLLSSAQGIYGPNFWAKPTFRVAEASYGYYFNESIATGKALAAAAAVAVLGRMLIKQRLARRGESSAKEAVQEPILILATLGLPFIGFLGATIAHGGMTARYTLPTILGFSLAVAYAFPALGRKSTSLVFAATLVFLAVCLGPQETRFWLLYRVNQTAPTPVDLARDLVKSAGHEDLPVVVSSPHDFLQIAHYAPAELAGRLVFVVDAPEAVVYTGSDTADVQLAILRSYYPLRVYDFKAFAVQNPTFLLYSGNGGRDLDFWPRKLKQDGYALRSIAFRPIWEHDYLHRVFLVGRTAETD
jgi:4-amino-4-deoxy-L-arabinose transferase-like glycosyltransferase